MRLINIITTLIILLTSATIYGILYHNDLIVLLGHILLLPIVGVWYGIKRRWSINSIDKIVYVAFLLGSVSDAVILLEWHQISEFIQISISFLMNLLLLIVFRKEGTRIYSNKITDSPKIILPAAIIFLFFGYFLIPSLPNSIYFVTILYAILELLLVAHGFFRIAKGKSYLYVALGVSFVILKDVIYSLHFFVYNNTKPFLYAVQYPLNILAYFMIAVGIAYNQNSNSGFSNNDFWVLNRNKIKLFISKYMFMHFFRSIHKDSLNRYKLLKETFRYYSAFWY